MMLTFAPPLPWWLIVFLLALLMARSLEGLLGQLGDYFLPRITEALQGLKTAIADRWGRLPAYTAGTAQSQGAGTRESQSSSGADPPSNTAIPGLSVLLDVIMFCAALPGSAIILYVGLNLVLPESFFPSLQPEETADRSVASMLLRALRSPAGITAVFFALVQGLAGAHLFESVEIREAFHLRTLWQRPLLVLMLALLSLAEGVLAGARTYYYLYVETFQNPPTSPEERLVIGVLKVAAVVVVGLLGWVAPWVLALGGAACRIALDAIGRGLCLLWEWVVGVASAAWSGVRKRLGVVIELAVLITGWILVWGFRILVEGLIGLIGAGAALWRGPAVILGSALLALKDWLKKFLEREQVRSTV